MEISKGFQIDTKHLIIRYFQKQDILEFMRYRNDEEWMIYQEFKGLSYHEYEEVLLKEGNIEKGIQLAIVKKETQKIVGDLFVQKEKDDYWIGYTIAPWASRHGYAYEAVLAFVTYLKEKGVHHLYAQISRDNEASIHLIEKLGFTCYICQELDCIYEK